MTDRLPENWKGTVEHFTGINWDESKALYKEVSDELLIMLVEYYRIRYQILESKHGNCRHKETRRWRNRFYHAHDEFCRRGFGFHWPTEFYEKYIWIK